MRPFLLCFLSLLLLRCEEPAALLTVNPGDHVVLVGNNLCSRMQEFGHFETELQLRFPEHQLFVRNMCDGGNTPGFRPHSARPQPWAFPGAERFQTELARDSDSQGFYPLPDEWLTNLEADVILAFFGYSESFAGPEGLGPFRRELRAFLEHTSIQEYNGEGEPRMALISPVVFEDRSADGLPDGSLENENLRLYASAMQEVADSLGVPFVDLMDVTKNWRDYTTDGHQLTEAAYGDLAEVLTDQLFGGRANAKKDRERIRQLVLDKNWFWHNDYKIPNGVHAYGRRYDPFGPDNYPMEIEKIRQMTLNRDTAIWTALAGGDFDLAAADANTRDLPPVETNYQSPSGEEPRYLYGEEAVSRIYTAPGYKVELFASEREFPDLANPCQMAFDNRGRLWVAVMPTYPHYRPGDSKPNDKLLILEDTDGDGKADKQTIFVDGLHVPVGFELAPEGVYVSQGTHLKLFTDTDGDDRADREEIILSGFDDHDTHHTASAFCADPSGAIYMGEGVFLHTNVETAYGTVRGTNGGFYRYQPQRRHLERTAQISIPNPWGIAFDDWGQPFFAETSGPPVRWMLPSTLRNRYAFAAPMTKNLIEEAHRVRPTSGLEFIHSRHFPEEVQGDMLINNTIGFLGMKQHQVMDDGTGYDTKHRQDLFWSDDPNFRPVDMEFAPDGSLYFIDWHNVLIGHMQHNARDPLRDHVHGRVYRLTYPARPLVQAPAVADASIEDLLENLKEPEYRTRYRTRRELRGRDANAVLAGLTTWLQNLDPSAENYERLQLEALWVSWGLDRIDESLLRQLLEADDHRVRAAAVLALRYNLHRVGDATNLLERAARDDHGRVRMAAVTAATWLPEDAGRFVLNTAENAEMDDWLRPIVEAAPKHLTGDGLEHNKGSEIIVNHLKGTDREQFSRGWDIYNRDGYCGTCHQPNGKGLIASGFPPLKGVDYVTGDPEILAKIILKGLIGPLVVNGREYPGQVPMTPYEKLLSDEEIADVMTYVRNAFGNRASVVSAEQVAAIREKIKDQKGFYRAEDFVATPSKR
jgi:mono/diheme cytochrome c family protein/glucose/arabinose dehydrogenase